MELLTRLEKSFVRELPGDSERKNFCRPVIGAFYSQVEPTPTASPSLIAYSKEAAELIGLNAADFDTDEMTDNYLVRKEDAAEKYFKKIKSFLENNIQNINHRSFIKEKTSYEKYANEVFQILKEV